MIVIMRVKKQARTTGVKEPLNTYIFLLIKKYIPCKTKIIKTLITKK